MKDNTGISIIAKSDLGCVRKNNEDAFVAQKIWNENTYLAVAIDGVGGYEGGEVAADIARRTIPEYLSASSNGERIELLKQAVTAANNAIFEAREADPEHGQMSCVLTSAIIDIEQKRISMAHIGDTRMYGFHHGKLTKLSHDHSIVGYREEIGDLSEEEAMQHPQRNVIGRDVGSKKHKVNDDDFIEAQEFPLRPNTTLLLCSDGLTDLVTSSQISDILSTGETLDLKTNLLIDAALQAGGKDNITVVLFEYQGEESDDDVQVEESLKKGDDKNSLPVDPNKETVPVKSNANKKTWSIALASFLTGLIVGGLSVYLYRTPVTHMGACGTETQSDTTVSTVAADPTSLNITKPLIIEELQVQNDSLRQSNAILHEEIRILLIKLTDE